MVLRVSEGDISEAHLIQIDISAAEGKRSTFAEMMAKAEHSADVCVSFNGEKKEFTLQEFGRLLGFEQRG